MNTARVVKENKPNYILLDKTEEFVGVVRGVFHQEAEYPKVGDYVRYTSTAKRQAVIEEVLPRTSAVIRRVAGGTAEQVVVANVSLVFIVMALDNDFNMNRLERYVLLAEQSSVQPVVVLNKADLVSNPDSFFNQVKARFPNLSIEIVSAVTGESMEALGGYVSSDTTVVLLGSSGAGKSTITNWFMRGVVQETKEVREDDSRGRHTAVARELFSLPSGGYIIDTPGMRELGLIGEVEGDMFKEIESLMKQCKYYDYDHEKSDGSAVKGTTHEGFLSDKQFQNYLKLKKEKAFQERKADRESDWKHKQEERKIHKERNKIFKRKKFEKGV
jgi:ribosome biogenesis GTPase